MSTLFQEIHEQAHEQDVLASLVLENTRVVFEGFTDDSLNVICESAAKYLGQIALQLQNKKILDMQKAVDMITGLRVLGSAENREAFNIKLPTFKVLVNQAGDAPNVDAALAKLANNPSVGSVRKDVEAMLNGAMQGDDNGVRNALQNINKLRLGYERVQGKLSAGGDATGGSSKPTAQPAPNQAGAQQAAQPQPQAQSQPAPQSSTGQQRAFG